MGIKFVILITFSPHFYVSVFFIQLKRVAETIVKCAIK
jgi:hypothetical protein